MRLTPFRLAAALLALSCFAPRIASACSCTNVPELAQAITVSDAIFTGRVLSIAAPPAPYDSPDFEIVTFQVYAWWKGGASSTALVWNGVDDGICGVPLDVGTEWLIFAYPNYGPPLPDLLGTHSCWRVLPLEYAGSDLNVLGPAVVTGTHASSWGRVKQLYR